MSAGNFSPPFVFLLSTLRSIDTDISSSSEPEKSQQALDLLNDQESRSLGVEAYPSGRSSPWHFPGAPRHCATTQRKLNMRDEEYFIKKLWSKAKNAVKQVGKVVEKTAKGVITSKAADIVKKVPAGQARSIRPRRRQDIPRISART
ncbi:hypothetical protein MTO96_015593 [Rhipicephalus appendiculatus]